MISPPVQVRGLGPAPNLQPVPNQTGLSNTPFIPQVSSADDSRHGFLIEPPTVASRPLPQQLKSFDLPMAFGAPCGTSATINLHRETRHRSCQVACEAVCASRTGSNGSHHPLTPMDPCVRHPPSFQSRRGAMENRAQHSVPQPTGSSSVVSPIRPYIVRGCSRGDRRQLQLRRARARFDLTCQRNDRTYRRRHGAAMGSSVGHRKTSCGGGRPMPIALVVEGRNPLYCITKQHHLRIGHHPHSGRVGLSGPGRVCDFRDDSLNLWASFLALPARHLATPPRGPRGRVLSIWPQSSLLPQ